MSAAKNPNVADNNVDFSHPWGAQTITRFHAGFTHVLDTPSRSVRRLLNKELEAKMSEILSEQSADKLN